MKLVASLLIGLGVATAGTGVTLWRAAANEDAALATYPPSGQILDIDGVKVHAHVAGAGPDLVLLHGAGGSLRDFTFDLVQRLSDRYRVIAFDRPGHGYTDAHDPGGQPIDSPQAQVALLQAAADQLSVTRPLVLGHSFGGAVAMSWALERPTQTAGLVLLAGATMPWPGELDPSYQINAHPLGSAMIVPAITAYVSQSYARNVLAGIFEPQSMPETYPEGFGLTMALRRSVLRANARQVNGLRPHVVAMSARYPTLDLPVEILHGTSDEIVPLLIHSVPISELLPNATLTTLDGVGHMPHHADPQAVTAAIDRLAERAGLR